MNDLINFYYSHLCIGCLAELNEKIELLNKTPCHTETDLQNLIKCGHQKRVTNDAIEKFAKAIKPIYADLCKSIDFEELYDKVRAVGMPISGIGDLTIYDTAWRIGMAQSPQICPEQYVYLACGAKTGAEHLLGKGLKYREPIYRFEPFFGTMPSWLIEDFFCVMKNYLPLCITSSPCVKINTKGKTLTAQKCNLADNYKRVDDIEDDGKK